MPTSKIRINDYKLSRTNACASIDTLGKQIYSMCSILGVTLFASVLIFECPVYV